MAGYEDDKAQLLKRMARIEGQVRGIAKMIENDRYCIEVLDQVSAVNKGLERVALALFREQGRQAVLGGHVRHGRPRRGEGRS